MDFDSVFDDALKRADDEIFAAFGNVNVIVEGYETIRGIFDNPSSISELSGGGHVVSHDAELSLRSVEATHIVRRTKLVLQFSDSTTQKYMVIQPESDGTGHLKVTLSKDDGEKSAKPSIRY